MQLTLMTATELAAAIRSKESSSTELVESYLDRIEALNPGLGAVVTVAAESARSEAREADRCLARGEGLGPMHGLPVTVKDCLETAGMRTTCGARELADYVPDNDAVAVRRLRRAGAIIVGKTNLPAWASDCQSYNELFGTINNPWDASRTPGGSSGGAAASRASALARARTCYDHLAGALGVSITTAMTDRGLLDWEHGLALTPDGAAWLAGLGITLPSAARRPPVRSCLDWTDRRPHLAGVAGAALCAHAFRSGWITRISASRAVTVTDAGWSALRDHLGLVPG